MGRAPSFRTAFENNILEGPLVGYNLDRDRYGIVDTGFVSSESSIFFL